MASQVAGPRAILLAVAVPAAVEAPEEVLRVALAVPPDSYFAGAAARGLGDPDWRNQSIKETQVG